MTKRQAAQVMQALAGDYVVAECHPKPYFHPKEKIQWVITDRYAKHFNTDLNGSRVNWICPVCTPNDVSPRVPDADIRANSVRRIPAPKTPPKQARRGPKGGRRRYA